MSRPGLLVAARRVRPGPASPTPVARALSPEERIQRLEKLLADTRAEVAALQGRLRRRRRRTRKLDELERRIDILAQRDRGPQDRRGRAPTDRPGRCPDRRARPDDAAVRLSASPPPRSTASSGASPSAATARSCTRTSPRRTRAASRPMARTSITLLRAVLYLGYKFDDHFVSNTELEYENAVIGVGQGRRGRGRVRLPRLHALATRSTREPGLVLIPDRVSSTSCTSRPRFSALAAPTSRSFIIPTTWRESASASSATLGPVSYRAYVVNGLNATGLQRRRGHPRRAAGRLRGPRLELGVHRPRSTSRAYRVFSSEPRSSPELRSGPVHAVGSEDHGATTVFDAHPDLAVARAVAARSLRAHLDRPGESDQPVERLRGRRIDRQPQEGWYVQGGFDVLSSGPASRCTLIPFVRYEQYDTQTAVPLGYARNPENDRQELTARLRLPADRRICP